MHHSLININLQLMKPYILFLLPFLLLCSCRPGTENNYTINGYLPSTELDGEYIYLVPFENASPETVDSALIADGQFRFSGNGEEIKILRMRPVLRLKSQEILLVTEPGVINVNIDSISWAGGTPQNDVLQLWKEESEFVNQQSRKAYAGYINADNQEDMNHFKAVLDSLRTRKQNYNYEFLRKHGNTTVGRFVYKIAGASLTEEQKNSLTE